MNVSENILNTPQNLDKQYELVEQTDPVLHTATPRFDFSNPPIHPVELYNILGNKLKEYDGLGLAAPQLGLPYNFFVIRSDPIQGFFNAKIVDTSDEQVILEEGCLSYPGLVLKVKRPKLVRIRFADPEGTIKTLKFQDMTARIVQHELDHVEGVVFTDRVSRLSLEMAIKKANKNGHKYKIGDLVCQTNLIS